MSLLLEYGTKGIDFNLPGNGGFECANFLSPSRRILETLLGLLIGLLSFFFGFSRKSLIDVHVVTREVSFREILLSTFSSFILGMEFCYKLASRQGVFIVNPCHLLLALQIIVLLSHPNSYFGKVLFRLSLSLLHGPVMAILFPVTNTLVLPGEIAIYWLEHFLILYNAFILLRNRGRDLTDYLSWSLMSYTIWVVLHFILFQLLSHYTLANLNAVLCPAISDPFYGQDYRTHAIWHQFLLTITFGKLTFWIGKNAL